MELYKTVRSQAEATNIIEKSRFIAHVKPVSSKEEADDFVAEIKGKYKDATHNVPAMVIGDKFQIQWASDDGEPQGTSGAPMVQMLVKEGITNVVIVVTRYFGGVLLGTGGLVRAYTQAVKDGLSHCEIGAMVHGYEILLNTDYNGIGKVLYTLGQYGISPVDSDYGADVTLQIRIQGELAEKLHKELIEITNGKIGWEQLEELYFVDKEK